MVQLMPELRRLCVVRTYIDIENMVFTSIEIERVLGDLGEIPYDPFMEEKDEDTTRESSTNKHLLVLNETLIHFFGNMAIGMELMLAFLGIHLVVNYAKLTTTL
jgi:hypothetical protein